VIRIGSAWVAPADIAAVQQHHEDHIAVFLRSGQTVLIRGVTVGGVIEAIDRAAAEARKPVIIYEPAPDPVRTPWRARHRRSVTIPTPPAKDWR